MDIQCLLVGILCSNGDLTVLKTKTNHAAWTIHKIRVISYGTHLRLQLSFLITGLFREVGRQCKEDIKTGTASFGFADSNFGDALPSKTRI